MFSPHCASLLSWDVYLLNASTYSATQFQYPASTHYRVYHCISDWCRSLFKTVVNLAGIYLAIPFITIVIVPAIMFAFVTIHRSALTKLSFNIMVSRIERFIKHCRFASQFPHREPSTMSCFTVLRTVAVSPSMQGCRCQMRFPHLVL